MCALLGDSLLFNEVVIQLSLRGSVDPVINLILIEKLQVGSPRNEDRDLCH